MNAVVIAVVLMLALSLMRVNVVLALIFSAMVGGLIGGLSLPETATVFGAGLGGGAYIALSYAMLGVFAVAISRSGITDLLAQRVVSKISGSGSAGQVAGVRSVLLGFILSAAILAENLVPVHIAFIPILIPPLLHIFARLRIDRRLVACLLTFGLTASYMAVPFGFGRVFLIDLLYANLAANNLAITEAEAPLAMAKAMAIPVGGMFVGLLIAVFFSYRKPRDYSVEKILVSEPETHRVSLRYLLVALVAIVLALVTQVWTNSIVVGSLAGVVAFILGGVIRPRETEDVFVRGVQMMAMIGLIMIAASGFAEVMKATGGIDTLVTAVSQGIGDNKPVAAVLMLLTGLLITMGIGSSFSTIPIIASIYVPLAAQFDFSVLATASLVGTAAALGDAGSPASDSTLGPTAGLDADGQHDHIWDTVVPTFIHYNIPLIIFGTIAALVL